MLREKGLLEIDEARWVRDDAGVLNMLVRDADGRRVRAWLSLRPVYCDRGHIQLNVDGDLELDAADSFPRYFFSFAEADRHARAFLRWRIWHEPSYSREEITGPFYEGDGME